MAGTTPSAPFVAVLTFEPTSAGTPVEVQVEFRLTGPTRLAGPIVLAWYGRAWGRGRATLKGLMESGEI